MALLGQNKSNVGLLDFLGEAFIPETMQGVRNLSAQRELRSQLEQLPAIGTGSDRGQTYSGLLQRADVLERMGQVEMADQMRQRALQFSPTPTYATSSFNAVAPDGSIIRRSTSQTGEVMDFGNVSASPDTLVNIGSARAGEQARVNLERVRQQGRQQQIAAQRDAQLSTIGARQAAPGAAPSAPARTKPLSATEFKELSETEDVLSGSQNALSAIDQALKINDKAYFGVTAKPRAIIESQVGGNESADATIQLDNLIQNQALGSMKSIFGGNPTEGERKILLDLQASASKTPKQRAEILRRARASMAARIESGKKKATAIRSGTYGTTAYEQQRPVKRYNPATGKIE